MNHFQACGKWILAGEHSVLRGGKALVFPVKNKTIDLYFEGGLQDKPDNSVKFNKSLVCEFDGDLKVETELVFLGALEKAISNLNVDKKIINGKLKVNNSIPLGAGMGASAGICVVISKLFSHLGFLEQDNIFNFSRTLEDVFHGQSSGVDISVAMTGEPVCFSKDAGWSPLAIKNKPIWYLSYSGNRGMTADCVRKVNHLIEEDSAHGDFIDRKMNEAVDLAEKSLASSDPIQSTYGLTTAIEEASSCFKEWGLISSELQKHMAAVDDAGSLAVKPTGSGDGGFVLSLWGFVPQPHVIEQLNLIRV